ncbi:phosphoribosylglycinamide formyltransferase [Aerococcus urinaeequi]|uniref:Phosphoribosylglycinamide formyltransferase n=1 Tax=Aerococcus viridans TaxID=1377 RepID=A0A2N6UFH9_9LACT|nr:MULTISPECIES: phosphoribosylglycinamide formyltransferase [Aerococcus]OFU50135.1 phosphoribosylglycinamide formyltransferase [Aerococcus sp. HMSC10H05]PMC80296.1 phosphoribosylglycinamide formyltransferase [Aerococcus viridans]
MIKIGVLISGNGTNLQAVMDACRLGILPAEVAVVISNQADAYGLKRAEMAGIDHLYANDDQKILASLKNHQVDIVVLAGYLKLISKELVQAFEGRMINIHPSLIPAFSGKGYYGLKVHQAVIDRGVKVTGATVHLVDERFDEGKILIQEPVQVLASDDAKSLQASVLKVEHRILITAIADLIQEMNK